MAEERRGVYHYLGVGAMMDREYGEATGNESCGVILFRFS